MTNDIITWIDKKLFQVNSSEYFKFCFYETDSEEIEGDIYLTSLRAGIEIVMTLDLDIVSIHLFGKNTNDTNIYKGPLPLGLDFSFNRIKVNSLLGPPEESGGGAEVIIFGYMNFWEKYFFENFSLHVQYSTDNKSIDMITIESIRMI